MRHYDTSCGPMSCVPTRKDGVQVRLFHKWYRYTTAQQYRGLMTNSGMPSFLVGTQDIGPHEVS